MVSEYDGTKIQLVSSSATAMDYIAGHVIDTRGAGRELRGGLRVNGGDR